MYLIKKLFSHKIIRQLKIPLRYCRTINQENDDQYLDDALNADREFQGLTERFLTFKDVHSCYIIQPYIKWGPKQLKTITPEEQLDEAKALITTLPQWTIEDSIIIPLENFDQKYLFKSGTMEKLKKTIIKNHKRITAIFINLGDLKRSQAKNLENEFHLPILDRYRIVMQILKIHATSKHAKLQVAMAELHYLQRTTMNELLTISGGVNKEKFKLLFQNRESKLKGAIKLLRKHRSLLRNRRIKNDYPIVAVVGYTNAGKTSLIKSLTGDEHLQPRDQLFATLDVTLHAGLLPSGLKVLYVDTVGFLSDIPTTLIECFVATLEDAVLADLIIHVEDVSSSFFHFKRDHVLRTLHNLSLKMETDDIERKILNIGNKCDLIDTNENFNNCDDVLVSAKTDTGLDALRYEIEKKLIQLTNREIVEIKVPAGGDELRWLYKNANIISEIVDKNNENIFIKFILSFSKLQQFKHYYGDSYFIKNDNKINQ